MTKWEKWPAIAVLVLSAGIGVFAWMMN